MDQNPKHLLKLQVLCGYSIQFIHKIEKSALNKLRTSKKSNRLIGYLTKDNTNMREFAGSILEKSLFLKSSHKPNLPDADRDSLLATAHGLVKIIDGQVKLISELNDRQNSI